MTRNTWAEWPVDEPRIAEILDIVAKETGVERDRLTPNASISSLDIASLDMVQAMFALESEFNIEIPVATDHGSGEFATVADLVKTVLAAARGRSLV